MKATAVGTGPSSRRAGPRSDTAEARREYHDHVDVDRCVDRMRVVVLRGSGVKVPIFTCYEMTVFNGEAWWEIDRPPDGRSSASN
jgi:hypothetical protein